MKKLYLTALAVALMAPLIPLAPLLAVAPGSPGFTHWLYMLGHGNVLHWLVNGWTLLMLHNVFRWYRLLTAYLVAVAASFILPLVPYTAVSPPSPVLGASVITAFFLGWVSPHYWQRDRLTACFIAAIIIAGFFIPGIAAAYHALPYALGILAVYAERAVRSFLNFAK